MVKRRPSAGPKPGDPGSCASSGRAWRLWAVRTPYPLRRDRATGRLVTPSDAQASRQVADSAAFWPIQALLRQVAEALQHLHGRGVVHRDVKPENLLLADRSEGALVKLCDFGLACEVEPASGLQRRASILNGTVAYMAPEHLREEPHGAAVDLWSLGIVLFILLSGRHPFDPDGAAEEPELAARVKAADWAFGNAPCWRNVSDDGKRAVRVLLEQSPARRPSASELLRLPWLQGAAPAAQLPGSHTNLRAFNEARRLFRRARREAVTSVALRLLPFPPPRPPLARCAVHSAPSSPSMRPAPAQASISEKGRTFQMAA